MILPVYVYGQPVLRKVAEDITPDYPNLKELIQNAEVKNGVSILGAVVHVDNMDKLREAADFVKAKLPVTSVSRNELLQERKFEFAFENQRWFDLQRVVGVSETIRIMEAHGQDSRLLPKQKFTKVERFQMLYPIPGREIRLLGKEILSQNEGYN